MSMGKTERAVKIMKNIAKMNKREVFKIFILLYKVLSFFFVCNEGSCYLLLYSEDLMRPEKAYNCLREGYLHHPKRNRPLKKHPPTLKNFLLILKTKNESEWSTSNTSITSSIPRVH